MHLEQASLSARLANNTPPIMSLQQGLLRVQRRLIHRYIFVKHIDSRSKITSSSC